MRKQNILDDVMSDKALAAISERIRIEVELAGKLNPAFLEAYEKPVVTQEDLIQLNDDEVEKLFDLRQAQRELQSKRRKLHQANRAKQRDEERKQRKKRTARRSHSRTHRQLRSLHRTHSLCYLPRLLILRGQFFSCPLSFVSNINTSQCTFLISLNFSLRQAHKTCLFSFSSFLCVTHALLYTDTHLPHCKFISSKLIVNIIRFAIL